MGAPSPARLEDRAVKASGFEEYINAEADKGRRLDHIWVSPALKKAALSGGRAAFRIHEDARGWERPSDHAPVMVDIEL